MAYFQWCRCNKNYDGTLSQTAELMKKNHWHNCFFLKFHKSIVRSGLWKVGLQIFLYIIQIKVLVVTVLFLMKKSHIDDNFTFRQYKSSISGLFNR